MASKREQILAAVKTNLANTTGVADRIYRSRVEPIARGALRHKNVTFEIGHDSRLVKNKLESYSN